MKRLSCPAICLAGCLAVASAAAGAQTPELTELSFEDLAALTVQSASKFVQSAREAPSAVEVLTRDDIRRHGWRTLAEALPALTGVYLSKDGAYDFLGARGFLVPGDYSTRFLLLIDGMRSNDNIYEQAAFGTEFPLDLALVERIEYVPGPGSSIYGSNAIFGVINVITRRTEEMSPFQAALGLTQDGRREVRATAAKRLPAGGNLLVSVTGDDKLGHDRRYADPGGNLLLLGGGVSPDGRADGLEDERRRQLFARYDDGGFSLTVRHGERRLRPSSALYETLFNDGGLKLYDEMSSVVGRYQRQLGAELGIDLRLEHGEMIYKADYPFDDGAGNRYLNRDATLGRWWAGDFRALYDGIAGHKLVGGVELQADKVARQRNFDVGVAINPGLDVDSARRRAGFYLQDEWAFAARWRLNLGLRHDRFSGTQSVNSPRLGLIWLAGDATTFKLLGGKAFRMPNAYERDYVGSVNYLANPNLQPESIRTLEGIWEQRLGPQQTLRLAVYNYRIGKLIEQVDIGGGVLQYQNRAQVDARGIEVSWRRNWESGVQLGASLAANRTENEAGRRPGYSPPWLAKLRGSLPLPGTSWLLAADVQALGGTRFYWNGTPQHQDTRLLADVSLLPARQTPGWDGHLRIRNLFDRRFSHPGSEETPVAFIPGHRRTLEVALRYAF